MFRKENGVTLVALVVTIIVLLILAGVTISMVLGDQGIITNAQAAAKATEKSDMESAANYANLLVRTDSLAFDAATYPAYTAENIGKAIKANSSFTDVDVDEAADVITITGTYGTGEVTVDTANYKISFVWSENVTE